MCESVPVYHFSHPPASLSCIHLSSHMGLYGFVWITGERVICIGKLWLVQGGILGSYQMCERICRLHYGAGLCIKSEYEDSW